MPAVSVSSDSPHNSQENVTSGSVFSKVAGLLGIQCFMFLFYVYKADSGVSLNVTPTSKKVAMKKLNSSSLIVFLL